MASISAALIAGGLGAAGSVASGIIGSNAAQSAAQTQAQAADTASQNSLNMFNETRSSLMPWMNTGNQAQAALADLTGAYSGGDPTKSVLGARFQPTMAQLSQTPGYQFSLTQGLQGVQNSYAAQGLGQSGAALKGAANYAEGLAGTTYQQQFNNYMTQNQQLYNQLYQQSALGENATAMVGNNGLAATGQANQYLTGGAAAQAAGTVGSANAIGGALQGATGSLGNSLLLSQLYGNGGGGMFGGGTTFGGYNYGSADLASAAQTGVQAGLTFNPLTGVVE